MTAITVPPTTAAKDSFLRFAMRLDAGITGALGVANAAIAPWMSSVSGLSVGTEYALSAFFIVYGITVFGLSMLPSVGRVGVAVVIGNVVFTVAAVAVVLLGVWPLTAAGIVLTLASGVFTLAMAELQYLGLRRMRV